MYTCTLENAELRAEYEHTCNNNNNIYLKSNIVQLVMQHDTN